ncbi:MAG: DNA (cytosine-5-)-methyltransferase [Nitrospira sp. WS110]|nr:DNA (cytosine-5-)-methyltransferase [Nitrospira sp. WS110]
MKVGSLFAGIGGFDLGLERAGFEIAWQVEIDPYCQAVLAKHWPRVKRYGDIKQVNWGEVEPVDVLCGGFPCQDLSFAGNRAGIDGERSVLWREYIKAIRALRPRFIIVENVPGLLTNEYMGRVLGDLAASRYDAEWDCIPAFQFGLDQERSRLFLVAYPHGERCAEGHTQNRIFSQACSQSEGQGEWVLRDFRGRSGRVWRAPISTFDGVAYGISSELDRIRAAGNAIVPQIAEWLGRMIQGVARSI